MKIIWTPRAASDLDDITDYIRGDNPSAAIRVRNTIEGRVRTLAESPEIGRIGEVPGTLELVCNPWPYIVVYRIRDDDLRIILVRHGAQDYPPPSILELY